MTHARGCGKSRTAGGIYAETPLSPHGYPVTDFLMCPPERLGFDLPVQGIMPIEYDGVAHALDWVGEVYYPNIADFVEEVKRMGVSRKFPDNFPFELLTRASRLLTVHARAHIYNLEDYGDPLWVCPKNVQFHPNSSEMCAGLWWWDVDHGEPAAETVPAWYQPPHVDLLVQRTMPSFSYFAHRRPDGVEGVYAPAIFAGWPIARLVVVRGEHGEHESALETLSTLKLTLEWGLVDE